MTLSTKVIPTILFFIACCYVLFRALLVGFTHDEALTYQIIQGNEFLPATANDHWLNTWLASITYHLPLPAELALRLPNVIAFAFFGHVFLQLSKQLFSPLLAIGVTIVLFGNPFLLDYFSLCRGYGLSLAFLLGALAALYGFYTAEDSKKFNKLVYVSLLMIFGVLSNLNLINIFILVHLWIGIALIRSFKAQWKYVVVIGVLGGTVFFIVLLRLLFLKAHNELYFGTSNLQTSLDYLLLGNIYSYSSITYLSLARWIFLIAFTGFQLVLWYQSTIWMKFISTISLGSIILLIIQHYFFDTLYPLDRSAIYFMPLFVLVFALGIQQIGQVLPKIGKSSQITILFTACIYLGINLPNYNVKKTCTWPEFENTKSALLRIKKDVLDGKLHELEATWIYEPIVNFYRKEYQIPVYEVFRADPTFTKEYLLIQDKPYVSGYKRIAYYKEGKISVFKRLAQ